MERPSLNVDLTLWGEIVHEQPMFTADSLVSELDRLSEFAKKIGSPISADVLDSLSTAIANCAMELRNK